MFKEIAICTCMGNTCGKDYHDSFCATHTQLMTEFVNQYCAPDENNIVPLSNFMGIYWDFVNNVKRINWDYGLVHVDLIILLNKVLYQFDKNARVIGPKAGNDVYIYRSVIGVRFNTFPIVPMKIESTIGIGKCKDAANKVP